MMPIHAERLILHDVLGVVPTPGGLMLKSHVGLFEIPGTELPAAWAQLAPLLDGRFALPDIEAQLPAQLRVATGTLLDLLRRIGLVGPTCWNKTNADAPPPSARSGLLWFLGSRTAMEGAARHLGAGAQVRIGWTAVLDDEPSGASASGAGSPETVCGVDVDVRPAMDWITFGATLAASAPELIVCLWPMDAVPAQFRLARLARQRGVPVLYGSVAGGEVTIGPLATPDGAACWNCARLRRLANWPSDIGPAVRRQVALSWLDVRPAMQAEPCAAGLLGALVASRIRPGLADTTAPLRNAVETLDLVTLRGERHPLVRLPRCKACGGPPEPASREPDAVGRGNLEAVLSGWVGPVFGVVQSVRVAPSVSDGAIGLPWIAEAAVGHYVDDALDPSESFRCWGKGVTTADAVTGALGEAIERYSAAFVPPERLVQARIDELDGDAVDPASLGRYAPAQLAAPGFPFGEPSAAMEHQWLRGTWLHSRKPVWMPALATFYSSGSFPGEGWTQVTTSGLAAGAGWDDAALSATLELVERHACLSTWIGRLPARRVRWTDPGKDMLAVLAFLQSLGASVEFYLLEAGVPIPTILCLALGDGRRWPAATVSAAADLGTGRALRRALLEQGLTGPSLRDSMLRGEAADFTRAENVSGFRDHALHFCHPASRRTIDTLRSRATPLSVADRGEGAAGSLGSCCDALGRAGWHVAVGDLTSADVATTPLRVVRAMAAGSQPLYCGYGLHRVAVGADRSVQDLPHDHFVHPFC